jgi:hypothetical protein
VKNTLIISKREVTRLRSRFTGRTRFMVVGIVALAITVSFVVYQQDLVLSKSLYTVGVSPDAPAIDDDRFNVLTFEDNGGFKSLYQKTIDVYVRGEELFYREDERSQYATGALKQYLEKQELVRISNEYDIDKAFPLRIEVRQLETEKPSLSAQPRASLSDILGLQETEQAPSSPSEAPAPASGEPSPDPVSEPAADAPGKPTVYAAPAPQAPATPEASETVRATDDAVLEQLEGFDNGSVLPEFKAEFVSDRDILIPSLMKPPTPLAQVILAFLYVVPLFFVSVFFTSSFMEEKTNRKLVMLLSAPITPLQIILGKMLPYLGYSIISIIAITLLLKGNVLLGLAIFIPVMLFIISIYLMVALLYRTFKDQTFFSVLAVWVITAYLVAPAMFSGVSDLSYISPLTLAVQMYRGEPFGLAQYFLSTTPMFLVFLLALFVGTRIFNEEYLMGFRPLHTKLSEAVYLAMNKSHLNVSILLLRLFVIPVVFMVQLASIVMASNLPMPVSLWALLAMSVVAEETAKSAGIAVLLKNKVVDSRRRIVALSFISALGFLVGEKLLLYLALSVVSESMFTTAIFNAGLLVAPLMMHFVATSVVCLLTSRLGIRLYPVAIVVGAVIHALYNLYVIGVLL